MTSIADMTLEELRRFVEQTIDDRLLVVLGNFDLPDDEADEHGLTWDEIRESVARHRWTPPIGAKPAREMLREIEAIQYTDTSSRS